MAEDIVIMAEDIVDGDKQLTILMLWNMFVHLQEKCDLMSEYIRRLKLCIKWFQQLEGNYITEQESLKGLLESAEKKCNEIEMLMKAKEEKLNSIIMELRKNIEALEETFVKEESAKLEVVDSLNREKHARDATEKLQASLSEELKRAQQDNESANQKIQSLNITYKGLQEYNRNLQDYNSRLQKDLGTITETLKCVENEKASAVENLRTLRGDYTSLQEQLTSSRAWNHIRSSNACQGDESISSFQLSVSGLAAGATSEDGYRSTEDQLV